MGGRHVSTVFGAMNMSGSIGAFVFPVIVPLVREATGSWDSVLVMFALIYLAAAVCWLLFNPSGTVFDRPGRQPASD
jgi:nitrate/nitrite transporter NarK